MSKLDLETTDKEFMHSFAKGVMTARGIDPEEYDISISKKNTLDLGVILVFCIIMQFVLWYASGQFSRRMDTSPDLFWALVVSFQFFVYPFIFELLRPEQMTKILTYAVGMLVVSGILDFIIFLLDMVDRIMG